MKISILNINNAGNNHIDGDFFNHLSIPKVFNSQVCSVLSSNSEYETIKARHEVFKQFMMSNEAFDKWQNNFYNKLLRYRNAQKTFESSKNSIEELLSFMNYAQGYIEIVLASINSFPGFFFKRLNSLAENEHGYINTINQYLPVYADLLLVFNTGFFMHQSGRVNMIDMIENPVFVSECIYEGIKKIGTTKLDDVLFQSEIPNAIVELLVSEYGETIEKARIIQQRILESMRIDFSGLKTEFDFYYSIMNIINKALENHLPVCIPEISSSPSFFAEDLYDISLIDKVNKIIPNDISLSEFDSVYFIRGANGGGKTTFLRSVALNLVLFISGSPIFASKAKIYPFSKLFAHFPNNEGFEKNGRLDNELNELNSFIPTADKSSFVFLNETFSSTDEEKGTELAIELAEQLKSRGAFCLFVTHFHKTSESHIPSLTTVLDAIDNSKRTFLIKKESSIKSSFAKDILKKYGLDKLSLMERRRNA